MGITIITIPHWWDRTIDSLSATILAKRPDISTFKSGGQPIPDTAPVPTIVTIEVARATDWDLDHDPTNWYLSERFDGIRAYWNGKQLLSKDGTPLPAPKTWTYGLPKGVVLDGELWVDYDKKTEMAQLEKKDYWENVKFLLFDIPSSTSVFEERIKEMNELSVPSHVKLIPQTKCLNASHFEQFASKLLPRGSGVMLREPTSLYEAGHSKNLRKIKLISCSVTFIEKMKEPNSLLCEQ